MTLPKGTNINTFIVLAGFVAMAVGWGVSWGSTAQDVRSLKEFREEALIELRQIDNLTFRIAAAERDNADVAEVLDELQRQIAQQSGDILVIKEILQRIEQDGQVALRAP